MVTPVPPPSSLCNSDPDPDSELDPDTPTLAAWLATRDAPCPVCSYNLRALTLARCPECSTRLFLTVGAEDLALGPFLFAVISVAMGMGFDGVVFILISVLTALNPPPSSGTFVPIAILGGLFLTAAMVCGTGLALLARRRPRWRRLPRRRQWAAAGAVFAIVTLGHAALGLGIAWHLE